MQKITGKETTKNSAGIRLSSDLRAGKNVGFDSLGDFVRAFVANISTTNNYTQLKNGLDTTVEQCKIAGAGKNCDDWAENFGLTFAHG